jgi:hypothetical protein
MLLSVAGRLLVVITLALWSWVLPVAHAMPIDADGPHGLSDNADLDDLIVSLTSPTAVVAPGLALTGACFIAISALVPTKPIPVRFLVPASVESRAPPLL